MKAIDQVKLGFNAAVYDTKQNLLHPFENFKVVFGFKKDESLQDVVKKANEPDVEDDECRKMLQP